MKKARTLQKPKPRYAKVLFDKDSPFKHQVVRDKTKYNRKKLTKEDVLQGPC